MVSIFLEDTSELIILSHQLINECHIICNNFFEIKKFTICSTTLEKTYIKIRDDYLLICKLVMEGTYSLIYQRSYMYICYPIKVTLSY